MQSLREQENGKEILTLKWNWNRERFYYCATYTVGMMLGSETKGGEKRGGEGGRLRGQVCRRGKASKESVVYILFGFGTRAQKPGRKCRTELKSLIGCD